MLELHVPSMYYRQKQGDLVLMHKIVNNYLNSNFSYMLTFSLTTTTRSHSVKLFKQQIRLLIFPNFTLTGLLMIRTIYHKLC